MPKPRNWLAVHAHNRRGGAMKDRRAPKGGARNEQKELLEEYESEQREPRGPEGAVLALEEKGDKDGN